jgi:sugar phosphate isomerase/epimerase
LKLARQFAVSTWRIISGYFPYALEETADRIRAQGFNTVQLDLSFKDIDFSTPEAITADKCRTVRETFRSRNLPVSCISGYTNIVHPDSAERKRRNDYLKAILRHARDCGSPYVISETGTVNPDSDWRAIPRTSPSAPTRIVQIPSANWPRKPMIMVPCSCSRPT